MRGSYIPWPERPATGVAFTGQAHPVSEHVVTGACGECLATFPNAEVRQTARELFATVTHLSGNRISFRLRGEARRINGIYTLAEPDKHPAPAGQLVLDRQLALLEVGE